MKRFEYEALDKNGKIIRGIAEAQSFKGLLRVLFDKQLRPMTIQTLTGSGAEISRLKRFANRIEGHEEEEEEEKPEGKKFKTISQEPQPPKQKIPTDWSYILFVSLVIGLIIAMIMTQGFSLV